MKRLPAALLKYLKGRYRPAVFLDFAMTGSDDPLVSKLTGQPYREPDEPWPSCAACGESMHHLFQVDPGLVSPSALPNVKLLTFYYCIACAPADYTQPGWHVSRREHLGKPAPPAELPAIPAQFDQPGPLVLLGNQAISARVRHGEDLPGIWDEELRERLGLNASPNDSAAAALGATQVLSIRLRHTETGEITDLRLPMTDNTDPDVFVQHIQPPYSLVTMQLGELSVHENYSEAYNRLLMKTRGGHRFYAGIVSKVGGWLDCEQEPQFRQCPCGQPLRHVATIRTITGTSFVVGDIGAVYLTTCEDPACSAGSLIWWMDHT